MHKPAVSDAVAQALMGDAVPYEIWMMRCTANILAFAPMPVHPVWTNALIESLAIHARALIDFFNGRHGSDARHFTSANYKPFKEVKIGKLVIGKLNQQVAHITEKRTGLPAKKLNTVEIGKLRRGLDTEIAEFSKHMTPKYQGMWDSRGLLRQPLEKSAASPGQEVDD